MIDVLFNGKILYALKIYLMNLLKMVIF